jgi:phosphatidylinositol glycan class S
MDDNGRKVTPEADASIEPNTVECDSTLPEVSHQSISIHRTILLAYWLVVLISVPIWWSMTSIERLKLPNARILLQEDAVKAVCMHLPILA